MNLKEMITTESRGHEILSRKLKDIEARKQPTDDDEYKAHIERMKQQQREYLKKNPNSIYKQPTDEEQQRLDPKCWKGHRKAGTKMKNGVRVNNCVPVKESEKPSSRSKDLDPLDNAEPLSALGSYDQDFSKAEYARLLKPFIDRLPRDQQIVLNMHYWKGYNPSEIAEILQIKRPRVVKLISDALYSIRRGMYIHNSWKTDRPDRDSIIPSINENKVVPISESWENEIDSLVKLLESKS